MKQKKEIEKQKHFLRLKELNLDKLQREWKRKKYDEIQKKVNKLYNQWEETDDKIKQLKQIFVFPISHNTKKFVDGSTYYIIQDIKDKIHDMEIPIEVSIFSKPVDQVSKLVNEWFNNLPEIKTLTKKKDEIFDEIADIKTNDYRALETKIRTLKSDIRIKKEYIEKLSDIGYFRQHAKKMKKRKIREQKLKEFDEKIPIFKKWFEENYKEKMIQRFKKHYQKING